MAISFRHTGDQALDSFQRDVIREVASIPRSPLDSAVVLEDIDVDTTARTFDHGLGRVHQAMVVVFKAANVDVWEVGEKQPGKVTLQATAVARVSVMVW